MTKQRRNALAKLSFTEKLKILEQLRAMSKEVEGFGLRKKSPKAKSGRESEPGS